MTTHRTSPLKDQPDTWPCVYFCHNPKSGGTTINRWLKRIYPQGSVLPYELLEDLGNRSARELSGYRCYTGHFGTAILPFLPAGTLMATMLREPCEKAISVTRHLARMPPEQSDKHPGLKDTIQVIVKNLGDIEKCLQDELYRAFIRDLQSRFFSTELHLEDYFGRPLDDWIAYVQQQDEAGMQQPDLAQRRARDLLDRMSVVGIYEDYDRAADLLVHSLGLPAPSSWPIRNADPARFTASEPRASHAEKLPAAVKSDLQSLLAGDYQLYDYAQKRYATDLSRISYPEEILRWPHIEYARRTTKPVKSVGSKWLRKLFRALRS